MLTIFFLLTSFATLPLFYISIGKQKGILLVFTLWQFIAGSLAFANVFQKKPGLFPVIIIGTIVLIIFCLKKIDKQQLSATLLLSIHIVRIPVELMLYQLYLEKKVPRLMTFSGYNFDIITGISSLLLWLYIIAGRKKLNRQFFISWNIIGIIFLLVIVSLAILSSPLPIQQFAFNQPNIAVLQFPFCFLPTCIVPIVFISHILIISKQQNLHEHR